MKRPVNDVDYWVFFPATWFETPRAFRRYLRWMAKHDEIVCYSPTPLGRRGAIRVHQIYDAIP